MPIARLRACAIVAALSASLAACGRTELWTARDGESPDASRADVALDGRRPDVTIVGDATGPDVEGPDVIVTGCTGDGDCVAPAPFCDPASRRCVPCVVDMHCGPDQRCVANQCRPACGRGAPCTNPGEQCCAGACALPQSDPNNCGGCGIICRPGTRCDAGACRPVGCGACPAGQTCCGPACVDTMTDRLNCGACGVSCSSTEVCAFGACRRTSPCDRCAPGQSCCNDACVDVQSDRNNCGACGRVCLSGQGCMNGSCNGCGPCPAGTTCCSGVCRNLATDPEACGSCATPCPMGSACAVGTCVVPPPCPGGCPAGQSCCLGACVASSPAQPLCGACGPACPARANTVSTCGANRCAYACAMGFADCDANPLNGCEANVQTDAMNCGACGRACAAGARCVAGACVAMGCGAGPACAAGATCCTDRCSDTQTDTLNCGACGAACPAGQSCTAGRCTPVSTGTEGAFAPTVNPTYLTPGVHQFTTVRVPAGVVVYVAGAGAASGTLDLRASGDIVIDGMIDVSGGPGTQSTIASRTTREGRAGSGGFTGELRSAVLSPACEWVAGNSGSNGPMVAGTTGSCRVGSSGMCITDMATRLIMAAPVARFGGGSGVFSGFRAYGAGGGGFAGGGAGALGAIFVGEADCTGVTAGGGAAVGRGGSAALMGPLAVYNGRDGVLGQTQCPGSRPGIPAAWVGGGAGGSIGSAAANDLSVASTFYPGSGGGGGSADYLNRPAFGGTSGGGGGGGALRLWSATSITITGRVLANGGEGGDAYIGTNMAAGCDPQPGAAGGGGSGGVLFLRAPAVTVTASARVTAVGGAGGFGSLYASGGGGGAGSPGRIRLSVDPARCALSGMFSPALVSGCAVTPGVGTPGRAFISAYPN